LGGQLKVHFDGGGGAERRGEERIMSGNMFHHLCGMSLGEGERLCAIQRKKKLIPTVAAQNGITGTKKKGLAYMLTEERNISKS